MCRWGDSVNVDVTVPAHLSHTGAARRKVVSIDRCIAPIVEALNRGGCATEASCCGHGQLPGTIILRDDTWLMIMPRWQAEALQRLIGRDIHGAKWDGREWHPPLTDDLEKRCWDALGRSPGEDSSGNVETLPQAIAELARKDDEPKTKAGAK